ncbi:MAG: DUF4293 domain-containing protein [Bacteroidales bacterium]
MIQRIQSLYIFMTLVVISLFFFLPIAEIKIPSTGQDLVFYVRGIISEGELATSQLPLMILLIIIQVVELLALFSFKKRVAQIRLLLFNVVLLLGSYALIYINTYFIYSDSIIAPKMYIAFPLIAAIFNIMAASKVKKDINLLKSADRIR